MYSSRRSILSLESPVIPLSNSSSDQMQSTLAQSSSSHPPILHPIAPKNFKIKDPYTSKALNISSSLNFTIKSNPNIHDFSLPAYFANKDEVRLNVAPYYLLQQENLGNLKLLIDEFQDLKLNGENRGLVTIERLLDRCRNILHYSQHNERAFLAIGTLYSSNINYENGIESRLTTWHCPKDFSYGKVDSCFTGRDGLLYGNLLSNFKSEIPVLELLNEISSRIVSNV